MKKYGLVGEFNPFHNGHKYILDFVKDNFDPDLLATVMSSSFVQRGEPAMLSKWSRSEMAIKNGINLVIELPFIFACQNAEIFATAGIKILNDMGIDYIFFGSEDDDISKFYKVAKASLISSKTVDDLIQKELKKGNSFIQSRNLALKKSGILNEEEIEFMSSPNNILGIEYVKASIKEDLDLEFIPIKRKLIDHDSDIIKSNFASASKIRKLHSNQNNISNLVPSITLDKLKKESLVDESLLYSIFKFDILNNLDNIRNTMDYEDGIENRILNFIDLATDVEDLAEKVSSKRITKSRVKRIILNSLVRVEKTEVFELLNTLEYYRILGFDIIGQKYLSDLEVNTITNYKETNSSSDNIKKIATIENKATNLYSILRNEKLNLDFKTNPIIINN